MRRDFSPSLINLDGSPAKDDKEKAITFASTSLTALLSVNPESRVTAEEKARRYTVAMKINRDPSKVDLTAEEIILVKKAVGEFHGPLVVGQTYEMLEGEKPQLTIVQPAQSE